MQKAELRQYMQNIIRQISASDKIKENTIIFDTRQKELFSKYNNRAVYTSLSDEVDTKKIIQFLLVSDKKCLIPIQQEGKFFFTEITEDTKYHKNKYGILEPIQIRKSDYIPDAILIPWLAFTIQWHRLWRWLWRYDKCLAQYPAMLKIWMAYTEQIVENIPIQAHDQAMDIILSTQLYFRS